MKKLIRSSSLLAVLLLPCALPARPHHIHHHVAKKPALAKRAAAAAVAKSDLVGFWREIYKDESDTTDLFYDTLEIYYAADGKYEERDHGAEVTSDGRYVFQDQMAGTWNWEAGNFTEHYQACNYYDSETGDDNACDTDPDTASTADWTVATVDGKKTLTVPDTLLEDTTVYTYVGASAQWLLVARTPASLRPAARGASSAARTTLFMGVDGLPARALDLRGRALTARPARGAYILP